MSDFCTFVPEDPSCVTTTDTNVDGNQGSLIDTPTDPTDPIDDTTLPTIDEPNPEPNTKIVEDLD